MNIMGVDESNSYSENSDSDGDTWDVSEINELFSMCPHAHSQSLGPYYILHLSATSETSPSIAAARSDNVCAIYDLCESKIAKKIEFKEHSNKLIGCKFSPDSNNILYTGSNDGLVKMWDLRVSKDSVITFADTTIKDSNPVKSLSAFDVSPCNRLLAAGTDLTEGEAFILFWDVRKTKLLGAYWESHTDDITQVKFNPDNSNKLLSGSTDGLINIYDLSESCEDNALQQCLNTEALVESLHWFYENGQWKISCITSTIDLQLWEIEGAEPYKSFRREDVAKRIKVESDNSYLVNTHSVKNSLFVLAGSGRKILRSAQIVNERISPAFQFVENTQRVRASWLNENTNLLITGGERGKLDIWKPDLSVLNFKSSKKK